MIGSGVAVVEALAVDWIGQNIYWADYVMQHIEVSRLDGKRRKILVNKNVTNPRALVLDPRAKSRYMFWSDWGKYPRIERANMDGSGRKVIVGMWSIYIIVQSNRVDPDQSGFSGVLSGLSFPINR